MKDYVIVKIMIVLLTLVFLGAAALKYRQDPAADPEQRRYKEQTYYLDDGTQCIILGKGRYALMTCNYGNSYE